MVVCGRGVGCGPGGGGGGYLEMSCSLRVFRVQGTRVWGVYDFRCSRYLDPKLQRHRNGSQFGFWERGGGGGWARSI